MNTCEEGMEEKVNKVVLPGDVLWSAEQDKNEKDKLKLGPGIRRDAGNIIAFKAGILRSKDPNIVWVDNNQKRYVPVKDDTVIGIVTKTGAENFKIDIGSSMPAVLGNLSFEGATKRNRPNLQIGDLVYAKLSIANKDMEPELTCVGAGGKSNGLGQLADGFMITVSLGLARKLLRPDFLVLRLLGKNFPFEVTVGLNGRVWIKSKGLINTIAVANAITNSEFLSENEMKRMVEKIMKDLAGF